MSLSAETIAATSAANFQAAQQAHQNGQVLEAETYYRRVLEVDRRHVGALNGLAMLMELLGKKELSANVYTELGCALIDGGRLDEAEKTFRKALELNSPHVMARAQLSLILWEKNRLDEAAALARSVVELHPAHALAWQTLGLVACKEYRTNDAIPALETALAHQPDLVLAHNYLGICLNQQGHDQAALAHYEATLRLQPGNPHAHFNRALVWLSNERFHDGWVDYEWRFRTGQTARPSIPRPQWDGSPLNGRGLLIHTEQGMGDVLQFIRLLPLVKARGGRIVLACQKPLQNLLSRCEGIDEWFPIDEPAAMTFDLQIPILSLPGLLGINARNCPTQVPYVFPDPEKVENWKSRLDHVKGFKVGISWQGSGTFRGDHLRSIPLKQFAPLARIPGVTLISLQKNEGTEQLADALSEFPIEVLDQLDESGGAFMDTAAAMRHLDLIISCDTAVNHLAGALGRPAWLALSTNADWRWLRGRGDSPWYPTMRLFRQQILGDWENVFTEMAAALKSQLASEPATIPTTRPVIDSITVEIAPGELIDKMTILEIKQQRITDQVKLRNVHVELEVLKQSRERNLPASPALSSLTEALRKINEELWEIEDRLRECERNQDLGERFVQLARAVYRTNDRRSRIKRDINELLGSRLVEEKSYQAYD